MVFGTFIVPGLRCALTNSGSLLDRKAFSKSGAGLDLIGIQLLESLFYFFYFVSILFYFLLLFFLGLVKLLLEYLFGFP